MGTTFFKLLFAGICLFAKSALVTIMIKPVIVNFNADQFSEEIVLENESSTEKIFHASVKSWHQADNQFSYPDTDRVIIFPGSATIPPNGTQKFRIVVKQHPREKTQEPYRIIFSELPSTSKKSVEGVHFSFLFKLLVPVFVMGKEFSPAPKVSWDAISDPSSKATTLTIRNTGNTFFKIRGLSSTRAPSIKQIDWLYILPNSQHTWTIDKPLAPNSVLDLNYMITDSMEEETRTISIAIGKREEPIRGSTSEKLTEIKQLPESFSPFNYNRRFTCSLQQIPGEI